jgi:hypothetical protein
MPRNPAIPVILVRIVQSRRDGSTWYYAGQSTWVREPHRAKLYRTVEWAEKLAREYWTDAREPAPRIEAV